MSFAPPGVEAQSGCAEILTFEILKFWEGRRSKPYAPALAVS